MKNKTLYFLCDSRYFLEELKKGYKKFLIFFFLGILLLIYQQRSSLINIIIALFSYSLLLLMIVIDCNRCEKYRYIIEELFIKEDKIIIFHNNKKKRIEKYRIEFDEIIDLEYKDGFFLNPYRPHTFFHKHIEKCRLLKIKLKSKKVVSFGFFLEEKEGRKIIKAIKESKENYEKIQKEIKEFQENKKNSELLYNKALEERYQEILKKIIEEEKFYISQIEERLMINGSKIAIKNLEIFKNMEWEEENFYLCELPF